MITKKDQNYINMCFTAARDLNKFSGARVTALLIYKNTNVLAWGQNQNKTHPLQAQYAKNSESIFLHSEIDALRSMLRQLDPDDLRHCTLYVARAKYVNSARKEMIYGNAKPCTGCTNAIEAFRIKKVVYSTDEQDIAEL